MGYGKRRWSGWVMIPVERDFDGVTEEVCVDVWVSVYSDPGRTYGPPEKCYPPESDEEVREVVATRNGEKLPWTIDDLTEDEQDEVISLAWEEVEKEDDRDASDYAYELERDRRAGFS